MGQRYRGSAKVPHSGTAKVVGKSRQDCRWWLPVLQKLQVRFKRDFAGEMAWRAGRHPRVCEKWKTGRHAPDGGALHALINSDVGDMVILALTQGNAQPWAKALRRTHEISNLRKLQSETTQRLEALERGID